VFNLLCTGSPNDEGIAKSIKKVFPNCKFLSRRNGVDLNTFVGLQEFEKNIKNYNVFINNAHIGRGVQEILLKSTISQWSKGHIFNVGSISELPIFGKNDFDNFVEKQNLRNLGFLYNNEKIKITHLMVGAFKSTAKNTENEGDDFMHPDEIANIISMILKFDFEVPIIGIHKSSDRLRKWYNFE